MKRLLVAVALLSGCSPSNPPSHVLTDAKAEFSGRFEVKRAGVFDDMNAYNGTRVICVIHDRQTGREFVGISGIGISETGSQPELHGKIVIQKQDER